MICRRGLDRTLRDATGRIVQHTQMSAEELDRPARKVVLKVSEQRSTWIRWNVYTETVLRVEPQVGRRPGAETGRALPPLRFTTVEEREQATEALVAQATGSEMVIRFSEPDLIAESEALRRTSDGQSVYVAHGSERYTTSRILTAKDDLVHVTLTRARVVDPLVAEAAVARARIPNRHAAGCRAAAARGVLRHLPRPPGAGHRPRGRLLAGYDADLAQEATRLTNRLHHALLHVHPALERLLGKHFRRRASSGRWPRQAPRTRSWPGPGQDPETHRDRVTGPRHRGRRGSGQRHPGPIPNRSIRCGPRSWTAPRSSFLIAFNLAST